MSLILVKIDYLGNSNVLAVVADLFFSAKINEAAKHAGVTIRYGTAEKDLLDKAASNPALIVFDLNFDAAHPLDLICKLKGNAALKHIRLLGYLSHVQTELKLKAEASGCDLVMPRSAFSMNLPEILKSHASPADTE